MNLADDNVPKVHHKLVEDWEAITREKKLASRVRQPTAWVPLSMPPPSGRTASTAEDGSAKATTVGMLINQSLWPLINPSQPRGAAVPGEGGGCKGPRCRFLSARVFFPVPAPAAFRSRFRLLHDSRSGFRFLVPGSWFLGTNC